MMCVKHRCFSPETEPKLPKNINLTDLHTDFHSSKANRCVNNTASEMLHEKTFIITNVS